MLKHQELHTLDEEEIRDEIKRRKKLRETREEREQLVKQIADEGGLPQEFCDIGAADMEEHQLPVEEELLKDDQAYTRKIERGRILEQSSAREIYKKNMPMRNLSHIEIRIWQQQLLDSISAPSDPEVIWVWSQTGDEGKHGSRDI